MKDTDPQSLKLFQRRAIKSKEELLQAIDAYQKSLGAKEHSAADIFYKPALIELMYQFKSMVEKCDLAYLDKPFEAYEIIISTVNIRLESVEYVNIVYDQTGEIESSEASVYPEILCLNIPFIPVEEFAKRTKCDCATVIAWIEDRKIKCAQKRQSGWYVAITQNVPCREGESGSYIFIGDDGDLSSVTQLQEGSVYVELLNKSDSTDSYEIEMCDSDGYVIERKQVTTDTMFSIEDALIRSQDVVFENTFIEVINEKKIAEFDHNPFLDISQRQSEEFIDHSELPEETKTTLKAMARSNCGENLFLSTLKVFSLEDAFLSFATEYLKSSIK